MQETINAILAKESLGDEDIQILLSNLDLVSQEGKERLGLVPATPVVSEPAKTSQPNVNPDLGPTPKEAAPVEEKPKRRTAKK